MSYFHQFQVSTSRLDICNDLCNETLFRANFIVFSDQNLHLGQIEKVVKKYFLSLDPATLLFLVSGPHCEMDCGNKASCQRSPGVAEARLLPARGRMHSTNY